MKKTMIILALGVLLASCAKMPVAVSRSVHEGRYEVLGPVETSSYAILGMWGTDGSYEALVEAAKAKYPGDKLDVVDVSISAENYFLWYTFDLKGTAIKYGE